MASNEMRSLSMKQSNSTHSFAWLNATQFFGALNDNVFKLLVVFFLVDHLGFDRKSTIGLAAIVFVIPFLLFSHAAGVLADRYSKQNIIFYSKCMEAVLMACGSGGHLMGSPLMLYVLLFLMCTQSAFFGPSKFGIIPETGQSRMSCREPTAFLSASPIWRSSSERLSRPCFSSPIFHGSYLGLASACVGISGVGLLSSTRIKEDRGGRIDPTKIYAFFCGCDFQDPVQSQKRSLPFRDAPLCGLLPVSRRFHPAESAAARPRSFGMGHDHQWLSFPDGGRRNRTGRAGFGETFRPQH